MSRRSFAFSSAALGTNKKFWIGVGVILWLCFVLSHIPAIWAGYLMTRSGDLALSGVSGNIWNGRASLGSVKVKQVDHSLGQVTWKLNFLSIFTLKPCAYVTSHMDNQHFEGSLCVGFGGVLAGKDINTNFPSSILQPLSPVPIDGSFSLHVDKVQFKKGQLMELNGKLTWNDAKINNGQNWMNLGSFGADMVDDKKQGLAAHVFDVSSSVKTDLSVALHAPTGASIKGAMTMSQAFQAEINAQAWMSMFATANPPDPQGNISYILDVNL